ncbi:hypothetical protein [Devosia sp.]|uniref:hypothetical protein n=1 Tax=Devosia sp. TaxID=1871048 RepID=UPI002F08DB8A
MKKLLVSLVAIGFASAAMAQVVTDFAAVDADASGDVSLTEAQAVWAELTEEAFKAADTNADGKVDQAEYEAYLAANPVAQ